MVSSYCDLHSHLYGCLNLEHLYYLSSKKETLHWAPFIKHYQEYFSRPLSKGKFPSFSKEWNVGFNKIIAPYYYVNNKKQNVNHSNGSNRFKALQLSFDIIRAVANLSPEEIYEVVLLVTQEEIAQFVEYRLPLRIHNEDEKDDNLFIERLIAFCEALSHAQTKEMKVFKGIISISRINKFCTKEYQLLKKCQKNNSLVRDFIVGVDFSDEEQEHPPKEKKLFFKEVQKDNHLNPKDTLAILYHVGEIYHEKDKSIESTIRWIWESSLYGANRLGHCLALGIHPKKYLGKCFSESFEERLDQIQFELQHRSTLESLGYKEMPSYGFVSLQEEKKACEKHVASTQTTLTLSSKNTKPVRIFYTQERVDNLEALQNWTMKSMKLHKSVIETCPSSNLFMGDLENLSQLPIWTFLKEDLPVVVASDDRGILQTNIKKEIQIIYEYIQMNDNGRNARKFLKQQGRRKDKKLEQYYTFRKKIKRFIKYFVLNALIKHLGILYLLLFRNIYLLSGQRFFLFHFLLLLCSL